MSKHRRAAKIDNSQPGIVKALRKIPGVSIELGHDDIIVGYRNKTFWYEIKNLEDVSKKTGRIRDSAITDTEKTLLFSYHGHYEIVWTVDQILEDIGAIPNTGKMVHRGKYIQPD